MEPGNFKIKRVGEDLPSETNETPQKPTVTEVNNQEPVITPPSKRENPLRLAKRTAIHPSADTTQQYSTCPECNAPVEPDAVMCISCGFNMKKGKKVNTKYEQPKRVAPPFPNQRKSQPRRSTKPSALSNFIFVIVFFGGIGGAVWYFFFKPLPPVYGSYESLAITESGNPLQQNYFTTVYEYGNHKNSIAVFAWRELEAHYDGKKSLKLKAKKNGEEFKVIKKLLFKKPKGVPARKIKVVLDDKDFEYFRKKYGDHRSPEEIAKDYIIAMIAKDKNDILSVVAPNPNISILWDGEPKPTDHLQHIVFNDLEVGSNVLLENKKFIPVTSEMVNEERRLLQPILAGTIVPIPIYMRKVKGQWKVNASNMISSKMRVKEKKDGGSSSQFSKGSAKEVAFRFLIASAVQDKNGVLNTIVPGTEDESLWDEKVPDKLLEAIKTVLFRIPSVGETVVELADNKIIVNKEMFGTKQTVLVPTIGGNDLPITLRMRKTFIGWRVDPTRLIKLDKEAKSKK